MQLEVSATRVMDKMAAQIGSQAAEIARLQATNEVLVERLREYVERDRVQSQPNGPALNGYVDDSQPTLPVG